MEIEKEFTRNYNINVLRVTSLRRNSDKVYLFIYYILDVYIRLIYLYSYVKWSYNLHRRDSLTSHPHIYRNDDFGC